MNNKNGPSKRVARPNPNANIGASGATASPPTTSAVDRLTAAQVEARLIAVDSWSKPGTQVLLKHLHRNAAKEAKATARQTADAEKTRGWQAVEQRLFGDPARLLSIDTDYGLGFSASLMDGPEISLIDIAGLVDTAELSDAVWGDNNWDTLVSDCDAATSIELDEFDEMPGRSDTLYWVAVIDANEFARELRELMVACAVSARRSQI